MTNEEKLKIAIDALKEIELPSGPYSTDHLKHAENVIENVATIAHEALEKITK